MFLMMRREVIMSDVNYKELTANEVEKLSFVHKNWVRLNVRLMARQDLSYADIEAVKKAHLKMKALFAKINKTDDSIKLKKLAEKIKEIEFEMQRAWKFPENNAMHSWWYEAPKCLCPKLDNRDSRGHLQYIREDCPLHGTTNTKQDQEV